ncbi:MAG: hydroxyacid dehydrogenase [Saprospiraceae bacterium]|nr:hydroxyacid dehydrogenase [Saprospiraceae bacterium]MBP7679680.1 hydroxyacid dehydrogenase [Saprospiraceae bacterium]
MKKVLITDDVHPLLIEGLQTASYVCVYQPNITLQEVHDVIADYCGLIINSKIIVDKVLLDKATQLRFVARLGSGMEIVDKAYAAQRNVAVISSPQGNSNAVAEHALGMLLALTNNIVRADRQVRQHSWQREFNRGIELKGKTIGIIGFGHTGAAFAKKLAGMEVRVVAYDKYKQSYATAFDYVTEASLKEVLQQSDVISLHLPLTAETQYMVTSSWLAKCKAGVIIINTSRGNIVHTADVLAALRSGLVRGACLDVFENEKPNTFTEQENQLYTELYRLDNVILTPHIAGWTHESKQLLSKILLDEIVRID